MSEKAVCNCEGQGANGGLADSASLAAELDTLQKLSQLRSELAEARSTIERLKAGSGSSPELDEAKQTISLLKARVAKAEAVSVDAAAPAQMTMDALKPLPKEARVVEHMDRVDPKILWRPGNRAWSMSQTVRNHPANDEVCYGFKTDPNFNQPKPMPASKNESLRGMPLAQIFDPIANVAAHDEVEAMKCDAAMPKAPLPPFTLIHKHMHHLSRYTMYFNILCWLKMEPRYGDVLDVSGSEPWLTVFDKERTKVVAVNYPKTDVHDLSAFPAESFDWVMADQVLEHLRFPQQAMDQIHRVLKPGGRAIMTSCAANPVHMFHDYWRYTMDAFKSLGMRYDFMDLCGSWGNGAVNAARSLAGQFSGEPGSMMKKLPNGTEVVDPLSLKLAGQNEKDHAMTVWMILRKK